MQDSDPEDTVTSHSHSSYRNLSTLHPRKPAPFCGLCSVTVRSPIGTSYKLFLTAGLRRGESCAVTIPGPENEIPKNLKNYLLLLIIYILLPYSKNNSQLFSAGNMGGREVGLGGRVRIRRVLA